MASVIPFVDVNKFTRTLFIPFKLKENSILQKEIYKIKNDYNKFL